MHGVMMPAHVVPHVRVLPGTTSPVRHSARTEYEGEGSFVTNTTYLASVPTSGTDETPKRTGSLSTMKLAELQGLASSLGLSCARLAPAPRGERAQASVEWRRDS